MGFGTCFDCKQRENLEVSWYVAMCNQLNNTFKNTILIVWSKNALGGFFSENYEAGGVCSGLKSKQIKDILLPISVTAFVNLSLPCT